jgi:UDP-N-acetylmuramate--alanine ligase
MSSIAEAMNSWGFNVQGSNDVENENIKSLQAAGIKVFLGHKAENIHGADYVVFSSAVPPSNAELSAARAFGIPVIERAEMLDSLMLLKKGIAVAGTHGKTTTTSFIGTMLDSASLSPTIVNGGIMNYYHSHNRIGDGEWLVAEACEAYGNLAYFTPTIAVITNIDAEHLDFYKTFDNLKQAFRDFIAKVPLDGLFVACVDHPILKELVEEFAETKNISTYGFKDADITADGIRQDADGLRFDVAVRDYGVIRDLHIPLAGRHNIQNALAAIAVARFLDIPDDEVRRALERFQGVKHRFTLVGEALGARIYDDYAHHPKEIETTLAMARSVAQDGRVFALFEPHRYSRITDLFYDFAKCFKQADKVLVLPIYSAGESQDGMKSRADLAAEIAKNTPAASPDSLKEAAGMLSAELKPGDLVVSMSAGSLKNLVPALPGMLSYECKV